MGFPQRVAVLGLDGVPYSLLKHMFESGHMPFMAKIGASGTFVPMETALPPISSVAWTSFMTGKNPGDHGIFGFTDLKEDEIALHLPSFDDIRVPTIWQSLPDKRSVVVNLPFTYPARPLSGVLISGFVAPIFERSIYPESLIPWLRSKNYRIDVDCVQGRQDRWGLVRELFETLSVHEEVMLSLIQSEPWDLFIGVITGTDRLHHFFFDARSDSVHPVHADFVMYYQRVDAFVRRFSEKLGSDTLLILLSDHGFYRSEMADLSESCSQDNGVPVLRAARSAIHRRHTPVIASFCHGPGPNLSQLGEKIQEWISASWGDSRTNGAIEESLGTLASGGCWDL